jgi:hypothetical protein
VARARLGEELIKRIINGSVACMHAVGMLGGDSIRIELMVHETMECMHGERRKVHT